MYVMKDFSCSSFEEKNLWSAMKPPIPITAAKEAYWSVRLGRYRCEQNSAVGRWLTNQRPNAPPTPRERVLKIAVFCAFQNLFTEGTRSVPCIVSGNLLEFIRKKL